MTETDERQKINSYYLATFDTTFNSGFWTSYGGGWGHGCKVVLAYLIGTLPFLAPWDLSCELHQLLFARLWPQ